MISIVRNDYLSIKILKIDEMGYHIGNLKWIVLSIMTSKVKLNLLRKGKKNILFIERGFKQSKGPYALLY